MTSRIETYEALEAISRTAKNLKGRYEVRCLDLVVTRRNTLDQAIRAAKDFQRQIDARVTVNAC